MGRLVFTEDGSHTIYVPELDEHYHSVHGAVQESQHIFINYGFNYCKADPVRIFEVGFGTGLNALLTAVTASKSMRKVIYTSVEKFPLDNETAGMLNHQSFIPEECRELPSLIQEASWNSFTPISENFILNKVRCDITADKICGEYDLIYFDAFGPDKQPEMWTPDIFSKLAALGPSGCLLVTYSVKGLVKRNLRDAGFKIELLPGPAGKRHVLRAVKI